MSKHNEERAEKYPRTLEAIRQLDRPTLEWLALELSIYDEEERGSSPSTDEGVMRRMLNTVAELAR